MRDFITVRHAFRQLRSRRLLSAIVVSIVGATVAVDTGVFAVLHATVFKELSFDDPSTLITVAGGTENDHARLRLGEVLQLREQSQLFAGVEALQTQDADMDVLPNPLRITIGRCSGDFFQLLGGQPLLGRTFTSADGQPGNEHVIVLLASLWKQAFGQDPQIIGRQLRLSFFNRSEIYEVIGVVADDYRIHEVPTYSAYVPQPLTQSARLQTGEAPSWFVVARMKPGRTRQDATTAVTDLLRRLRPEQAEGRHAQFSVLSLHEAEFGPTRRSLRALELGAGVLFLMSCVNVAGLLYAQASGRSYEFGLKRAIGATGVDIFAQLLGESVVLGAVGGVCGAALAFWLVPTFVALAPADIPRLSAVSIDSSALMFVAGVSLLSSLLFGIIPAAYFGYRGRFSLPNIAGGYLSTRRTGLWRDGLLTAQLGLVLGLLVTASLVGRSFVNLLLIDVGFDARDVRAAEMTVGPEYWQNPDKYAAFQRTLLTDASVAPGIDRTSLAFAVPPFAEGRMTAQLPDGKLVGPVFRVVDVGYFDLMRIPMIEGRDFIDLDRRAGAVIVNQAFALRYFPSEGATRQRLMLGRDWRPVIAVVGDVRELSVMAPPEPTVYLVFATPTPMPPHFWLLARSRSGVHQPTEFLTRVVHRLAPQLPVHEINLIDRLAAERAGAKFYASLVTMFAVLALGAAIIGVFASYSQHVSEGMREFGVRMALGAVHWEIRWLLVKRGLVIVSCAAFLGLWCGALLADSLEHSIVGLRRSDPTAYALAILALLTATACAVFRPLYRIGRLDPAQILRDN